MEDTPATAAAAYLSVCLSVCCNANISDVCLSGIILKNQGKTTNLTEYTYERTYRRVSNIFNLSILGYYVGTRLATMLLLLLLSASAAGLGWNCRIDSN